MDTPTNLMERAFELARSSACRDINEIRAQLRTEGYGWAVVEAHFTGTFTKKQLRTLIQARQKPL